MGFHEKSAWACLLGIVLVFVPYFAVVLRFPMAFAGLFVLVVIIQVVFMVAFHVGNAIMSPSIRKTGDTPPKDELDQLIELRAAKISGVILGIVVISWCMIAMYGVPALGVHEIVLANANDGNDLPPSKFAIPIFDVLLAVHVLFAGFVIANLVYYGTIVVSYRRLANG
ncbi:MAG: hypothetical protein GY819_08010 [Planctomycetaceae bacterium]|nr:hypothetical protein [Planctomycetaceae bacterium]MCP4462724.1 hypothetical protein [Planctomycetaceae bacterium]